MRPQNISGLDFDGLLQREWLLTNGLGGYASSTLCGMNTRKYHGLLVAAMSPPARRMVILSHVEETVFTAQGEFALSSNEYPGTIHPQGYRLLRAFSVEPFPRWAFQGDGFTIEKSLRLLPGENTVCLTYSLLAGDRPVALDVKPLLALRGIHELMYQWNSRLSAETRKGGLVRIPPSSRTPEIFFAHDGEFRAEPHWYLNAIYRRENERGYGGLEDLWNPGAFRWTLSPGQTVHFGCSLEPVELQRLCGELERAREDFDRQTAMVGAERDEHLDALLRAAAQFVVSSPAQSPEQTPAYVIAQYPWAPASARAALWGFTGLFMVPRRFEQGRGLLVALASRLRDGLIPTEFPESGDEPAYSGADTSLWFINAVGEYFRGTNDSATIRALFPAIQKIIAAYRAGTTLGICCDAEYLIASRAPGIATSWMDAKVGDWVVTPRQGRTVELNALWYNALRTAAVLASHLGNKTAAQELESLAKNVQASFNQRFWNPNVSGCFDIAENDQQDSSIRPNQLLAISLPYPVLSADRHVAVIELVLRELRTPMGVRSLSPRDPAYQAQYTGNVLSRDRAQHQGSVYPWLIGPLATAFLRAFGREEGSIATVRQWLEPCLDYLQGDGLGQLCELFDGGEPHGPRGAPASALSVAEILRCYTQDVLGTTSIRPTPRPLSTPPDALPPLGHESSAIGSPDSRLR
jgi:predicted glycogen debranching enzyme